MDKQTYLAELEQELGGLLPGDRQNALAYYNEFLEDAEAEGQMDASAVLGSPHVLAAQIKADVAMDGIDDAPAWAGAAEAVGAAGAACAAGVGAGGVSGAPGWTTGVGGVGAAGAAPAYGYGAAGAGAGAAPGWTPGGPQWAGAAGGAGAGTAQRTAQGKKGSSPAPFEAGVLITVILAILAIPIGLPLVIAVIALIFAVFVSLAALFFAFAATVLALLVTGLITVIVGFLLLFSNFAVGLFYMGVGLALIGLCILAGLGFWKLGRLCIKGVAKLFNAIRKKLTKRERSAQ
ncbi:MAG: DUF1700 domain-containing protein [Coriobacteriales bacterium]|nr:DUF1700 domain-containing protein [Coriobacteriales bacterium]